MRALLLCAAAACAAITNERLVDPVAKEMALADEKRYRENYAPRTPKELAEDERALQFYTKIMSQVTNRSRTGPPTTTSRGRRRRRPCLRPCD